MKSQKQWGKFGAMMHSGEMTKKEFHKRVHGVKYSKLPKYAGNRDAQRRAAKTKKKRKK